MGKTAQAQNRDGPDKKGTSLEVLSRVNKVDGLYPESLMERFPDRDGSGNTFTYLMARHRILWFWSKFPEGSIITEIKNLTPENVVFQACVYADRNNSNSLLSKGHALCRFENDRPDKDTFATAETLAIGRALWIAGFGTPDDSSGDINDPNIFSEAPVFVNGQGGQDNKDVKNNQSADRTSDEQAPVGQKSEKALEFEAAVEKYYNEFDKEKAFGAMITFGPEQKKRIIEVCKASTSEDTVKPLRWYLNISPDNYPDITHARTVAACKKIVDEFDSKIGVSNKKSSREPPIQATIM